VIAIELTFNYVGNFIFTIKSKLKKTEFLILSCLHRNSFVQPVYVRNRANTNTNSGRISVVQTALLKIFIPQLDFKSIINTLLKFNL